METITVGEIMTPNPITLGPEARIDRALTEMEHAWIRHLPVVDRDGRLLGLVSHRDLVIAGRDSGERVGDRMIRDVETVGPEVSAHEAAYLLLRHQIGCVPVTDPSGRLLGIVTATDFVRIAHGLLGAQVPEDQLEEEERESDELC